MLTARRSPGRTWHTSKVSAGNRIRSFSKSDTSGPIFRVRSDSPAQFYSTSQNRSQQCLGMLEHVQGSQTYFCELSMLYLSQRPGSLDASR